MSELQPGMLALVIGCRNIDVNVGKIVKLERFAAVGQIGVCEPVNRDVWVVSGEGVGYTVRGGIVVGNKGLCQSKHLLPIRPEQDPLHEKQQQELHA